MKKSKIIFSLLLCLGVSGCSLFNKEVAETNPKGEMHESRGVVDDFSDKVLVNGKQISLPTTLAELGADFTIAEDERHNLVEYVNEDGYDCVYANLRYKGEIYADVAFLDTTKDKIDNFTLIHQIAARTRNIDVVDIKIGDIQIGSTKEEVLDTFGEPNKQGEFSIDESIQNVYLYFNDKDSTERERILVSIIDNKVYEITIGKYPN